jgi:N-acetylglutamate synthase-like GNAT family acetyltransferase
MKIRRALPEDYPKARRLALSLGLDYEGMENDPVWIAEEKARVVGVVSLRKHGDHYELCSLGVDPAYRNKSLGKKLVNTCVTAAAGDVYLATVIPLFFEKCGFDEAERIPASMRKDAAWCEGCDRALCRVMVKKAQ